jgi:uncharacterized membrane protein
MYVIGYVLLFALGMIFGLFGADENNLGLFVVGQVVTQLVYMGVIAVFSGGVMMMGVRRANDEPVNFAMVFDGFPKWLSLVIAMVLQTILMSIGFLLLIIPGIYLAIGYGLTFPLIMEKGLGPWEAMEASRKAIHHSWFQIFGIYLLVGLIVGLSAIPLGIGLIWTIPMAAIAVGVVYRIVFGVEEATAG